MSKRIKISISIISVIALSFVIYLTLSKTTLSEINDKDESTNLNVNEKQWGLDNYGQIVNDVQGVKGFDINAKEAWEITKGDENVLVGVVDTGVEISNSAYQANVYKNPNEIAGNDKDDDNNGFIDDVNGWDFYNNDNSVFDRTTVDYHGTFISSIIAGKHTDDNQVWGVAPNVKIMPLKFISGSQGGIDSAIEAIEYGYENGVRIFNLSWDSMEYEKKLFSTLSKYNDAIFITSSGKGKLNVDETPLYPCSFDLDNIVCTTAISNNGDKERFSGYGSDLVSGPGANILGALPEGSSTFSDGSSFATAYVTGIAALAKSSDPDIEIPKLVNILKESETSITVNDNSIELIDAKKVLDKVNALQ